MKIFYPSLLLGAVCSAWAVPASAVVAERCSDLKAEYNEVTNTIVLTGNAPSESTVDWETTFVPEPLSYVSRITIERHIAGQSWPEEVLHEITEVAPGEAFSWTDSTVEPDRNYEYRFAAWVDSERGENDWLPVYTGVIPGAVTDFSVATTDHLSKEVLISGVAPELSAGGSQLSTMSIVIEKEIDWTYCEVATLTEIEAGAPFSYSDTNVELDKTYSYRAYALLGTSGKGEPGQGTVRVGLDVPKAPSDVACSKDGDNVLIRWTAPAVGQYGGSIDPDNLTYNLYMQPSGSSEKKSLVTGLTATQYTYEVSLDEQAAVKFLVAAVNSAGNESYSLAESEYVVVGPPCAMPFKESFSYASFDHDGWTMQTTQNDEYYVYDAWNILESKLFYYLPIDDYIDVLPQDSDNGMAVCYFYGYSEVGQTETLISPEVSVENCEKINVSFHYFDIPADGWANYVIASVSADGSEWKEIYRSQPSAELSEAQWKKVEVEVENTGNAAKLQLKLAVVNGDEYPRDFHLDNIRIADAGQSGVIRPESLDQESEPVYYNLQGVRVLNPGKGIHIMRQGDKTSKIIVR